VIGEKVMVTEKKDKEKFNRLQQEQRDLDASYQQSKLNKKERTLHEELMEGFEKEKQERNDQEE
jgi:hypothetical protein